MAEADNSARNVLLVASAAIVACMAYGMFRTSLDNDRAYQRSLQINQVAYSCRAAGLDQDTCLKLIIGAFRQ